MDKSETRIFLKHYLGRRFSMPALARRFGASRRTIHERVETAQSDSDLSTGGSRYSPRSPAVAPSAVSRGRNVARSAGNLANRGTGTRRLGPRRSRSRTMLSPITRRSARVTDLQLPSDRHRDRGAAGAAGAFRPNHQVIRHQAPAD